MYYHIVGHMLDAYTHAWTFDAHTNTEHAHTNCSGEKIAKLTFSTVVFNDKCMDTEIECTKTDFSI